MYVWYSDTQQRSLGVSVTVSVEAYSLHVLQWLWKVKQHSDLNSADTRSARRERPEVDVPCRRNYVDNLIASLLPEAA